MARRPVNIPPARLGDGDAAHARRGVGAAQDYPCAIGTPVYAMFPVRRIVKTGGPDAAGGHTLIGYADGRNYWVIQHLSAWQLTVAPDGRVALSGNSGTETDGPHVHAWVCIDGVRMNPERWLAMQAPNPTPAVVGPTITLEELMDIEEPFHVYHEGALYLGKVLGGLVHVQPVDLDVWFGGQQDPTYWALSDGKPLLEKRPPTFDTKNNPEAWASVKRLCGVTS